MTHVVALEKEIYVKMGFPVGTRVTILNILKSGISYVQREDGKKIYLPYVHLKEIEVVESKEAKQIVINQQTLF